MSILFPVLKKKNKIVKLWYQPKWFSLVILRLPASFNLLTYLLMNNAQSSGNNTEHAFLFFSGGLILYKNKCVYILLLYFSFNVIKLYYLSPYHISIGLRQTHIDNW